MLQYQGLIHLVLQYRGLLVQDIVLSSAVKTKSDFFDREKKYSDDVIYFVLNCKVTLIEDLYESNSLVLKTAHQ